MITQLTIEKSYKTVLKSIDLPHKFGKKYQGKVRDFWIVGDKRITVTTDRQSAFDVILGHIPYKGAVLNQLAAFWFDKTKKIVPNHVISMPSPNVLISKNCKPLPVEMVVRGYMSGVTKTSIWYSYQRGERLIYGVKFPDGMKKNEKLPNYVITPTTHPEAGSDLHDERLTRDQIIKKKIVPKKLYEQMEEVSLKLFDFGSKWCKKHGLILVDTKYEFGLYDGGLMLIDEIHTPDSARFWIADTYKERMGKGLEPENFDKEFLRLWYAARGYTGSGAPPKMTKELIVEVARRYISVYEKITGSKFKSFKYPIEKRIKTSILASIEPTRLDICKSTRKYTAVCLQMALKQILSSKRKISEKSLADAWLKELRKNTDVFPDGWYAPPPHGICVLIGGTDHTSRLNYDSLRPNHMRPNANIRLSESNTMIYAYASPVDRRSGIIGDFGMTIYLGADEKVQKHLQNCMEINQKIFDSITLGMKLRDVYTSAMRIIDRYGLKNNILSISDPTSINIGHTIPASYDDWTQAELKLLKSPSPDPEKIAQLISGKRKFVSPAETLKIRPNMAFTIEPRMIGKTKSNLPLSSYHAVIVIDEKGNKELLTNFDEVFTLARMDYML